MGVRCKGTKVQIWNILCKKKKKKKFKSLIHGTLIQEPNRKSLLVKGMTEFLHFKLKIDVILKPGNRMNSRAE